MKPELTLDVKLSVSTETARRAINILNMYLEDNPNSIVTLHRVVCDDRCDYTKLILQGGSDDESLS